MAGTRIAKITTLPPAKPSWLIDIPADTLINEKPVSIQEVAIELDLHPVTISALVKNEGLPGKKIGGRWEFYMTLVRAWRVNRQLLQLK